MIAKVMEKIAGEQKKAEVPVFAVGDNVRVHARISEGGKERIQVFAGRVIARDGAGHTETFTVRRVSHGVGVERVFPVHSPHVARIEIESSGHARRAKLYYLRGRAGKQTRLRERTRK
ncbi:MAG: 50S ribosomal protein L19 [Lentisphaerae bacterium]|nr:50S ribosomal protein L19 [Lentisphaerota bacterium]